MSDHCDDGGSAFPRSPATVKEWDGSDKIEVTYEAVQGMSLLDYFAGQALSHLAGVDGSDGDIANGCYSLAAAMIKERNMRLDRG